MKLLYTTLAIIILDGAHGLQKHWNLRQLGSTGFITLESDAEDINKRTCIEVKDNDPKNDQKLILGDCGGGDKGWNYENDMFRAQVDERFCMQAGRDGPVSDGEKMRLFRCDEDEELQKFEYNGGSIKPKSDDSLCVVFRGTTANVDSDPIIIKKCRKVSGRSQWSEGNPDD